MELSYGPGHNAAPLAEVLAEDTAQLERRADELIDASSRAKAVDDDTAGRCVTLAKMLRAHAQDVDKARVAAKQPFLDGGRAVDSHYQRISGPLGLAQAGVIAHIDAYRRKQEAAAAEVRRKLEEEAQAQRRAAQAAEQARQEAEAKAAASDNARASAQARAAAMEAELDARRRLDAANELAAKAEATVAAPIASEHGKGSRRVVWKVEITDLTAALRHARKVNEAAMRECVQGIFERQVKAGARELPGASVVEDSATIIR